MMKETTIPFVEIKSQEEYREVVAKFSWLVDFDLQEAERRAANNDIDGLAGILPRIALNVLAIRNFREGFIDAFPHRSEIQRDLYNNQDHFEARVYELVGELEASPHTDKYQCKWKELLGGLGVDIK